MSEVRVRGMSGIGLWVALAAQLLLVYISVFDNTFAFLVPPHLWAPILLIIGILFRTRWALPLAMAVNLFDPLYSSIFDRFQSSLPYTAIPVVLNALTCIALIVGRVTPGPASADAGAKMQRRAWAPVVIGVLLGVAATFGPTAAFFTLWYHAFKPRGVGGAPETSVEERIEWGKSNLGRYYEVAERWARQSKFIQQQLGPIKTVAPIGEGNEMHTGFTDGSFGKLNLEVIGERGTGILTIPHIDFERINASPVQSAKFTIGSKRISLVSSGNSQVDALGLRQAVDAMLNGTDPAEIKALFAANPGIATLPDYELFPLLERHADALADLGEKDAACEVYHKLIQKLAFEASSPAWTDKSFAVEFAERKEFAHEALRIAKSVRAKFPNDQKLGFYEEEVFGALWPLEQNRLPSPSSSATPAERDKWGYAVLQSCYNIAKGQISESKFIAEKIGRIKSIAPKLHAQNEVQFMSNGYLVCFMQLEVVGSNGSGTVFYHAEESRRDNAKLDPLSLPYRPLNKYLLIRSVDFRKDGEAEAELDPTTLNLKSQP